MRLRFTALAAHDLSAIADYIRARRPAASLRVRAAILDSLQTLVLFPELGRRQNVAGVRKLITRRYGYLVYYTLDREADEIIVLTIQHPSRARPTEDV
jgi:plasmid stabilization system protein ParE